MNIADNNNKGERRDAEEYSPETLKSFLSFEENKSDRHVRFITSLFGSAGFLGFCIVFFVCWIALNLKVFPFLTPFDPFPFPVLEMTVSLFAVILSVSVLINQNRQGRIDKIRQQVEFEINVRAEEKITKIINMVHEIHHKLGIASQDEELDKMKESLTSK